jgi:hypothetical protein
LKRQGLTGFTSFCGSSNIQIAESLKLQIKDALGAALSFTGSTTSGVVKSIAIGVYEGLPDI